MPEPLARRLSRLGSSGYIKVGVRLAAAGSTGLALREWPSATLSAETAEGEADSPDRPSVWRADHSPLGWTGAWAARKDEGS